VTALEKGGWGCFDRVMEATDDNQRIGVLEKKIDDGFAEMRSQIITAERGLRTEIGSARGDARSDFRTLLAVTFAMCVATILCIVGVLLQHHL
jgi:hypothetical protein